MMLNISDQLAQQIKARAEQEHESVEEFLQGLLDASKNKAALSLLVNAAEENRLQSGQSNDSEND